MGKILTWQKQIWILPEMPMWDDNLVKLFAGQKQIIITVHRKNIYETFLGIRIQSATMTYYLFASPSAPRPLAAVDVSASPVVV